MFLLSFFPWPKAQQEWLHIRLTSHTNAAAQWHGHKRNYHHVQVYQTGAKFAKLDKQGSMDECEESRENSAAELTTYLWLATCLVTDATRIFKRQEEQRFCCNTTCTLTLEYQVSFACCDFFFLHFCDWSIALWKNTINHSLVAGNLLRCCCNTTQI